MDRGVGKVLRALEETGQTDQTMVVFTTDHGDSLGDRGMLGKRAFYDEVARVPLLFHVPCISNEERRLSDQCELFDLTNEPWEQTNLFDDPVYRDRARLLATRIRDWQFRTDDTLPLPAT